MTTDAGSPVDAVRPKIVHLIHGTWPYGLLAHRLRFLRKRPIWVDEDSPIRTDIATRVGAGTRFERFPWSGNNSFAARTRAAEDLVVYLNEALEKDPDADHLLVAHSHGGTVAVEAMQREPKLVGRVEGILTLATPFVSMHPPPGASWERDALGLIARFAPWLVLLIALMAWAAADHAPELSYATTFARLMALGVFLLIVLHAFKWLPWFPMPGRKLAARVIDEPLPALDPAVHLFAVRAPRDEASLAIAAGQIFGVLSDLLWRLLIYAPIAALRRAPARVLLLLILLYALFGWLGVRETTELQGPSRIFAVALYASVVMCAAYTVPILIAFVVLFPASVALALAAGIEVLALPGLLTVDSEPLPAGGTTRELLVLDLPESDREHLLMRHSIYELMAARVEVARWIDVTPQRRAVSR